MLGTDWASTGMFLTRSLWKWTSTTSLREQCKLVCTKQRWNHSKNDSLSSKFVNISSSQQGVNKFINFCQIIYIKIIEVFLFNILKSCLISHTLQCSCVSPPRGPMYQHLSKGQVVITIIVACCIDNIRRWSRRDSAATFVLVLY